MQKWQPNYVDMAEPRQLAKAPATEAVIGIEVKYASTPDKELLERVKQALAEKYPIAEKLPHIRIRGPGISIDQGDAGLLLRSPDRLYAVQLRPARLYLSRLKPYEDWEPLFAATWDAWLQYRATMSPDRVLRVSTRYINKLELPIEGLDFDHYINIGPRLPHGAEASPVSAFNIQYTLPHLEQDIRANVRASMQASAQTSTHVPVILDIDVMRNCDLAATDDESIKAAIRALREVKNRLFFGSVTDETLRLCS